MDQLRGEIYPCRHCLRQCKIFAIFTHFFVILSLKLLKLGEIDGVKVLAWKSGGVKFWTNLMSGLAADQLKWNGWLIFENNRKPDVLSTCSRDPFITNWSPWVHVDKAHGAETVGGSKWGKAAREWEKTEQRLPPKVININVKPSSAPSP